MKNNRWSQRPTYFQWKQSNNHENIREVQTKPSSPQHSFFSSKTQDHSNLTITEYETPKKVFSPSVNTDNRHKRYLISIVNTDFKKPTRIPRPPKKKSQSPYHPFKIIKFLGKGQFSDVHLAIHESSGFLVALKILKKECILKNKMENQIAQEIKIQTLMQHPNIARLFTFFQTDTEIVLVLEYCSGGELYKQLLAKGCFQESQASQYVRQTAQAIMYLHSNEIMHRDLKPENILLQDNVPKLADFSFSIYEPDLYRQTQCGSLVYQAPEILQGLKYNKKCDIWALGVLAYELCCGITPWAKFENKKSAIRDGDIQIPNNFSYDLKDFLQHTLKKSATLRYTARQALGHKWIKQEQSQKNIDFEI